jgi:hypothetical protein
MNKVGAALPNEWTPGWEVLAETPCGQDIKAMTRFQGDLYVATANRIYRLEGKTLQPIELIGLPEIDPDLLDTSKEAGK